MNSTEDNFFQKEQEKQYSMLCSGKLKKSATYQREQIFCECGCVLSRANMKKHKKTMKHQKKLLELYNNN